jgi:hypothetical protein
VNYHAEITPQKAAGILRKDRFDLLASELGIGGEVCLRTGAKLYKTRSGYILSGYHPAGADVERYAGKGN